MLAGLTGSAGTVGVIHNLWFPGVLPVFGGGIGVQPR